MQTHRPLFSENKKTWHTHFPDWEVILWDDGAIRPVLANSDTKLGMNLLGKYDEAADIKAVQADIARFVILFAHGGLYADMDMECLKGFSWVFSADPDKVTATATTGEDVIQKGLTQPTNNSLLYVGKPESVVMKDMMEHMQSKPVPKDYKKVCAFAGPQALHEVLQKHPGSVQWLPRDMFEPVREYNLYRSGVRGDAARNRFPFAYTTHNFSSSWIPAQDLVLVPVAKAGSVLLEQRTVVMMYAMIVTVVFVPMAIVFLCLWQAHKHHAR